MSQYDVKWIDAPVFAADGAHIAEQIRVRSTGALPMSGQADGARLAA
jgi:hypothetical protein